MHKDFITKREIRTYFPNQTRYRIDKLFNDVRKHCKEKGVNIFSWDTVPIKLFCEYWGLDLETFKEVINKEKENEE